jgi:DNA modification methylase
MKPYYEQAGITIYHGDSFDVIPHLSGINAVITDPPYNAGLDIDNDDMSPKEFDEF